MRPARARRARWRRFYWELYRPTVYGIIASVLLGLVGGGALPWLLDRIA